MTSTLTQRLQRAVALRDAATPGEWYAMFKPLPSLADHGYRVICETPRKQARNVYTQSAKWTETGYSFGTDADAELIAAAPSIVQLAVELGEEVERLRAEMAGLRAALADCAQVMRGVNAATEGKSVTERCSLLTIFRAETLSRDLNAE